MIEYVVRYMIYGSTRVLTDSAGPWAHTINALTRRNVLFQERQKDITHCWVERTLDGRTVERYGAVLRRDL